MADKTIGDLTQAESIGSEDLFVLEQGGEAKKLKGARLVKYAQDSVSAQVTAATEAEENAATQAEASRQAAAQSQQAAEDAEQSATSAASSASDAEAYKVAAEDAQKGAEAAVGKTSYIGDNGNWYEWDATSGAFVDSGVSAQPFPYVQPDEPIDAPEFSLWVDTDEEALYIARAEGVGF